MAAPHPVAAAEELDADPRDSRRALVAGACLLAALIGAGSLVARQPPPPLSIRLERVEGSALAEDSFVRLQVGIRATDADELRLGEVRLGLAGAQGLGAHGTRFDARGRAVVQVDLTPGCLEVAGAAGSLPNGSLDLEVRDGSGATRRVSLPVPPEGQLERLVRYRCAKDRRQALCETEDCTSLAQRRAAVLHSATRGLVTQRVGMGEGMMFRMRSSVQ